MTCMQVQLEFVLEEDRASPFLWEMLVRAFVTPLATKWMGVQLSENAFKTSTNYGHWAVDNGNWSEMSASIIRRVLDGSLDSAELLKESRQCGQKAVAVAKKVLDSGLGKIGDREIEALLDELYAPILDLAAIGITPVVADYHDFALTNALVPKLEKAIVSRGLKIRPSEALSILVAHSEQTEAIIENIELLELAKKIKAAIRPLPKTAEAFWEAIRKKPGLAEAIESHAQKWCWIDHGYIGPEYSQSDFAKQIFEALGQYDVSAEKKRLEGSAKSTRKAQAELEKQLGLDVPSKKLVAAARNFMAAKAYRIDVRNLVYFAFSRLLAEVSARTGFSKMQLNEADLWEIKAILKNEKGAPSRETLESRHKLAVWSYCDGKTEILAGKEALQFIEKRIKKDAAEKFTELRGQTACPGYAKGAAKIVKTVADIAKIQPGDILISPMTIPDFLPAMTKAAAFVTDTGGVTCHAAIVARELNKPCVIGTKTASKTIKDGDAVEVDASSGIVRKIS